MIAIFCVANDLRHIFQLNEASTSIANLFCQPCRNIKNKNKDQGFHIITYIMICR